ncbi:MAG: sulfotransferase family protein [Methylococcales bacterium]
MAESSGRPREHHSSHIARRKQSSGHFGFLLAVLLNTQRLKTRSRLVIPSPLKSRSLLACAGLSNKFHGASFTPTTQKNKRHGFPVTTLFYDTRLPRFGMHIKLENHESSKKERAVKEEDNEPFFLVGCVRSGTTLLRDLLRSHPRLECPEETHFYRWCHPFGTAGFRRLYETSGILKHHRKLDGIDEEEFQTLFNDSISRADFSRNYADLFLRKHNKQAGRWFDKTPQNVYGIMLISTEFPTAKFIHIHRHPLNVVASLRIGKVIEAQNILPAVNFWIEAVSIMKLYREAWPDRVLEVPYERLTNDPSGEIRNILNYLGEWRDDLELDVDRIHAEQNKFQGVLTSDDIDFVLRRCGDLMEAYNYSTAIPEPGCLSENSDRSEDERAIETDVSIGFATNSCSN